MPFVALQPGPTTNTLGKFGGSQLITISGPTKTYPVHGQLLLTTVSEQPTLTLFSAVGYWLSSHNAVVPEELINPTGQQPGAAEQAGPGRHGRLAGECDDGRAALSAQSPAVVTRRLDGQGCSGATASCSQATSCWRSMATSCWIRSICALTSGR